MGRIEEELGLVTDDEQRDIYTLLDRPASARADFLSQLQHAVQVDISISNKLSSLNQANYEESPVAEESFQAILSTRQFARRVIFDRWVTLLEVIRPQNRSSINNTNACLQFFKVCLKYYEESGYVTPEFMPTESLRAQTSQVIELKRIDLEAVAYSRKYLGLNI